MRSSILFALVLSLSLPAKSQALEACHSNSERFEKRVNRVLTGLPAVNYTLPDELFAEAEQIALSDPNRHGLRHRQVVETIFDGQQVVVPVAGAEVRIYHGPLNTTYGNTKEAVSESYYKSLCAANVIRRSADQAKLDSAYYWLDRDGGRATFKELLEMVADSEATLFFHPDEQKFFYEVLLHRGSTRVSWIDAEDSTFLAAEEGNPMATLHTSVHGVHVIDGVTNPSGSRFLAQSPLNPFRHIVQSGTNNLGTIPFFLEPAEDGDDRWTSAEGHEQVSNLLFATSQLDEYLQGAFNYDFVEDRGPMKAIVDSEYWATGAFYVPQFNTTVFGAAGLTGDNEFILETSRAIDVVGHEFAHSITHGRWMTACAKFETDAISEAFSDLIGFGFRRHVTGQDSFRIGADVFSNGRGFRDMADPFEFCVGLNQSGCPRTVHDPTNIPQGEGTPCSLGGGGGCIDDGFPFPVCDVVGGVHNYGTILLHWFYLLTHGGFNVDEGHRPTPFGVEPADALTVDRGLEVVWDAFTAFSPSSTFCDIRNETLRAGRDGVERAVIYQAWKQVIREEPSLQGSAECEIDSASIPVPLLVLENAGVSLGDLDELDLPGATEGQATTLDLTVRNTGAYKLYLRLAEAPVAPFSVQSLPEVIEAGASATLQVRLDGANAGTFLSSLRLESNDDQRMSTTLSLRGTVSPHQPGEAIRPRGGLWWDPQRNGEGIALTYGNEDLVAIWTTYRESSGERGDPIWYLAVLTPQGELWQGPIIERSWDPETGMEAGGEEVGHMTIDFSTTTRGTLSFEFTSPTRTGTRLLEPFGDVVPAADSGLWFDLDNPGWGLLVLEPTLLGDLYGLYYFDAQGQPTWGLGARSPDVSSGDLNLGFQTGACPWCPYIFPEGGDDVGTISVDRTQGTVFSSQITRPSAPWVMDNTSLGQLTDMSPGN